MQRPTRLSRVIILVASIAYAFPAYGQVPAERARELYRRGKVYYGQGEYKKAQEAFKQSLGILRGETVVRPEEPAEQSAGPEASPPADVPSREESDYYIGGQDVLHIAVWQHDDLSGDLLVRPDGKISIPLIGDIQAVGRSIPDLDREVTERLGEFIRFPEVSISIRRIGGQRVIILGEVKEPGVYELTGSRTVLDAIGYAKGFTSDAVVSSVIIVRGGLKQPEGIRLNLNKPLLKADMSQNIALMPQDIIYVPKKFIANVNYFVNQIIAPLVQGSYTVTGYRNSAW